MKLPKGIETKQGNGKIWVRKWTTNAYIKKYAGCVWNRYLADKLLTLGFEKYYGDKCIFLWGLTLLPCYVGNIIFGSTCNEDIDQNIQYIGKAGLDIEGDDNIEDYIGVTVDIIKESKMKFLSFI